MRRTIDLPRRYPGLKPFERSQQAVFHGRHEDVQRLSNLILRERLVVLFAKSGIGKTSLLQAGVAPELERQDFLPLLLRTERTDQLLVESIGARLSNAPQLSGINKTGERPGKPQTLWEQMKRYEFDIGGLPATPVLVFDQFEETFTLTHREGSRSQFLNELAELVNGNMPESLRSELLQAYNQGEITLETMHWWEEQPDLRIVLSIRSDFLHFLDTISDRIPNILKNRYHLQPLDREKARTAIVMPAMAAGEFSSPVFKYSEEALEEVISFLAGSDTENLKELTQESGAQALKKNNEIEAVNLQIVCMDVEERIIDHQQVEGFEVTPDYYLGREGLRSSIRNFYTNQLKAFPKAFAERVLQKSQQAGGVSSLDSELVAFGEDKLRSLAQRLIEESLVTTGNRRNSVVDDTLLDEHKVTPDFLDTLVDKSRLLRKEPRLDDYYYEISHDTLLPVIIESRNKRRAQEQQAIEEAAFALKVASEEKLRTDLQEKLVIAQKQRRLARTVALLSFVSLLISLAFGIWFILDYVQSASDQLEAAENNVELEQYNPALAGYHDLKSHGRRVWVLKHGTPPKDVTVEIQKVDSLRHFFNMANNSMEKADSLMLYNHFSSALSAYNETYRQLEDYKKLILSMPLDDAREGKKPRVKIASVHQRMRTAQERKKNAREALIREFAISQRDYEVFAEAKVWGQAFRNLEKMQTLLPEAQEDKDELKKVLQLNTPVDEYISRKMKECQRYMR